MTCAHASGKLEYVAELHALTMRPRTALNSLSNPFHLLTSIPSTCLRLHPPKTLSTVLMVAGYEDLPKLLDTPAKQVKWAKKLVAEHLKSAARRIINKLPM